jgi:hypothetical protein
MLNNNVYVRLLLFKIIFYVFRIIVATATLLGRSAGLEFNLFQADSPASCGANASFNPVSLSCMVRSQSP